jgi:hypothetical protein
MCSFSGGSFRFLNLIKPVMCVLPEVEAPDRRIPFKEKVLSLAGRTTNR